MTHPSPTRDTIVRSSLHRAGRLPVDPWTLGDDENLFDAGLSSHASVAVLVDLEESAQVEFPDHLLRRSTFSTIAAIRDALDHVSDTSAAVQPEASR
ncbi:MULTISPECIES: phosphopantetheine-binding protein [unclassified Rhodococcus (in: high G+C Gram-positive bacteria)]|uniref:phosphopantetheine-binding protein n=1 Tax=unclassified Rhodococcus (in: high G+C Gram-positive bacteria) TaxID=192944 RepID=UPI00254BAA69|nr:MULTISPECIES: phosphopantetheine-binding protein [unclassified Rhodococcus (in: high G+C Gram-positive bacteria)]